MPIRTGDNRSIYAAIAVIVTCLPRVATAEDWSAERRQIDERFAAELAEIAARCDQQDLETEAKFTRSWQVDRAPGRIYLFLPPPSGPKPVGDEGSPTRVWFDQFLAARRAHAERLFQLAKKAARQRADWAYQLTHEVLREDPEHIEARQALAYRLVDNHWVYAGDSIRSSVATGALPNYGFASRKYHRIDSANFRILTNADEKTGRELALRLEQLHCAWRQLFFEYWGTPALLAQRLQKGAPDARPRVDKHRIVWFQKRDQYVSSLIDDEPLIEKTAGIYLDRQKTAFLYGDPAENVTNWLHEVTHQLFAESTRTAKEVGGEGDMWLIEGVALFMESLWWHQDYCTLGGCDADRLQFARYRVLNDNYYVPLAELIGLDRESMQGDQRIGALYSQSAGLTHYLMTADNGRHRPALVRYLSAIYRGRRSQSLEQLTGSALGQIDLEYREYLLVRDSDLEDTLPVTNLYLGHTNISDTGLQHIPLENLQWLDLGFTAVTDKGLEHLGNARQLKKLTLEHTKVTGSGLQHLSSLAQLEYLDLSGLPIDDAALHHLKGFTNLEALWLRGTSISDEGLKEIAGLKKLSTLDVSDTRVTAEGLAKLRAQLPTLSDD